MLTSAGLSPIAPPWASLTAYDLNSGAIRWKVPVGDVPALNVKGTGVHFPKYGPVVTAGGLVFIGTRDKKVRALDEDTGQVIWETELTEGMEGIPAVYEVNGREFIIFCAAAQSEIGTTNQIKNGAYVAFALPEE
jgi:quinoprotein glucose dehydrogenase